MRLLNDSLHSGIFHCLPRRSNRTKRRPSLHGSGYRGTTRIDWNWPLPAFHEEDKEQTSGVHSVRQHTINPAYRHVSGSTYCSRQAGREGNTRRTRRPVRMRCLRPTDAYARRTNQSGPLRSERNRSVPRPTPVTCGMPTLAYRRDTFYRLSAVNSMGLTGSIDAKDGAGAKAQVLYLGLSARLKSCPCYKAFRAARAPCWLK